MGRLLETGAAPGEVRLAALMLHGRGRTAEEMAELGCRLGVADVRFLCPEAPGNSWYPGRFLEPLSANQPALDAARATIDGLIDRMIATGVPADRILLCGFSQGGCLAADTLVRRPLAYAGALIFTGGLIGPPGTVWQAKGRLDGMPVLLTGSEDDDWVPAWRARETGDVLTAAGAAVETVIYDSRDHVVCDDEIVRARSLLDGILAA